MRRALAIALSAGAAAAPAHHSHHLLAQTVLDRPLQRMHRKAEHRRADRRRARAAAKVSIPPELQAIAACESGGNPHAIGGGGEYRGAFQFDVTTWHAVGGQGDPAQAPMAEQVRRAEILYAREGAGQWPVCGRY